VKGAIAAGHPLTAEAGARMLAEGGNAVDACLAAAFVSWVAESPLTGPGGGGFLLVHHARDGRSRLLDFFVTVPGAGLPGGSIGQMESVDVDFDSTIQAFRIGPASVAVPGTIAGLEAAHRRFATIPWSHLLEPAIELARDGIDLTREQAYLHAILDIILRHTEEGQRVYGPKGERLVAGDRLVMRDLAGTLELLAAEGARVFYDGELGRRLSDHVRFTGGVLTPEDLRGYRVIWRRPIDVDFREHRFVSNPPPSSGGVLLAYALRILDRVGLGGPAGSAGAIARLVEIMAEQTRTRGQGLRFERELLRGGLAERLCDDRRVEQAAARLDARAARAIREAAEPARTTHVAAVDAEGNAASLTASTGSGSGVVVPGTGVHLNNMIGEFDLNPSGRRRHPGGRLTSMMAPSIVLRDGRPRLVVGSAGSLRLRGAILQIVVNTIGHDMPVNESIDAPRVHLDEGHVHCEGGTDPAEMDELERRGYEVVRWRRRNLYFGGAAAVEMTPEGTLAAAGDPRRGGHGIVVDA
jgi:gamma-glutamyltranspeptidase/glutathione hydrolase